MMPTGHCLPQIPDKCASLQNILFVTVVHFLDCARLSGFQAASDSVEHISFSVSFPEADLFGMCLGYVAS